MPIATIQTPDGQIVKMQVPEGATEDQILGFMQQNYMPASESHDDVPLASEKDFFEQRGIYGNDAGPVNAYMYGITGGQIPFGNVVTSGLGAAYAKGSDLFRKENKFDDQSIADLYYQSLADTKVTQDKNQPATLAGNVTGAASVLPMAFSKALYGKVPTNGLRGKLNEIPEKTSQIYNYIRGGQKAQNAGKLARAGRLGLQSAKGAALAVPTGALYGAGEADPEGRLEGAGRGAGVAAAVGAAGPSAGLAAHAVGRGLNKLNTKSIIPGAEQIRQKASELYQLADQRGGVLSANFTDDFLDRLNKLKPQTEMGQMVGGDDALSVMTEKLNQIRGRPMTLQAAQEIDEIIGDAIDSHVEMGMLKKSGKKLQDVQNLLRGMIDDVDERFVEGGKEGFDALKEARQMWSSSFKLNDIEKILMRAEMSDNPATVIKNGFRTLSTNASKLRGYTPDERKFIEQAAKGNMASDILRTGGSRLIPIITGASTGNLGATAAGAAGSMASRGAATKLQISKANNVAKQVAKNSGLYREQKRISPDMLKRLMRMKPKDAKQAMEEMKLLPAPEKTYAVNRAGQASVNSYEDQAAAAATRQQMQDIGLTPDVLKAQNQRAARAFKDGQDAATSRMGDSELGRFMAQNYDLPLNVLEDLTPEQMKQIMSLPPGEARKILKNLEK